jgi:hypothetical protein
MNEEISRGYPSAHIHCAGRGRTFFSTLCWSYPYTKLAILSGSAYAAAAPARHWQRQRRREAQLDGLCKHRTTSAVLILLVPACKEGTIKGKLQPPEPALLHPIEQRGSVQGPLLKKPSFRTVNCKLLRLRQYFI